MPIRVGTNRIGSVRNGSNTIGSAFVRLNQVYGRIKDQIELLAIDNFYYATNSKNIDQGPTAGDMRWMDTGRVTPANLPYAGTSTTNVTINSGEGGYISSTGDAQYYSATGVSGGTDGWSARFWVRRGDNPSTNFPHFFQYGAGGSDDIVTIKQKQVGGNPTIELDVDSFGTAQSDFPNNVWAMYTIVYSVADEQVSLYKNDNSTPEGTISTPTATFSYGPELRLLAAAGESAWSGDTKLFAWYQYPLSAGRIEVAYDYDLANNF